VRQYTSTAFGKRLLEIAHFAFLKLAGHDRDVNAVHAQLIQLPTWHNAAFPAPLRHDSRDFASSEPEPDKMAHDR
jgi:hypothetical protein